MFNIIAGHNKLYLLVTNMLILLCHTVPVENEKFEARQQALPFQNYLPCFDQLSELLSSSWSFCAEEQKAIAVLVHWKGIAFQFPPAFLPTLLSHLQEIA